MTALSLDTWRVRGPGPDLMLGAAALTSVLVAIVSAARADLSAVDDRGLASALPFGFWVGLVALNLAFVLALGRAETRPWVWGSLLGGLAVLLYGAANFASDIPRNAVAWRHIGIAEALAEAGVEPRIDIYFNWPGFFAGLATFTHATGLPPLQVALWAPLVNVALWSVAVLAVFRVLTQDRSRSLLALWLFLLGNWIDQDYLAPQAFGILLYLVVLALVLALLGATSQHANALRRPWSRREQVPTNPDGRQRVIGLMAILVLCGAAVSSHQLTPAMLVVSLTALVLLGRSWAPWLPILVGLALVLWLAYPASTYLVGHPPLAPDAANDVVTDNLSARLTGSQGHVAVLRVRMALTACLWGLALIGGLRDWRAGRRDVRPIALAAAPFILFPMQSYGGEMLLRVTLFALPFVAFLAARALMPEPRGVLGRGRGLLMVALCSVLAVASITARYGNARYDMFTADEVEAVDRMVAMAPAGSVLVAGTPSTPWGSRGYTRYTRRSVQNLCAADYRPQACQATLRDLAVHEGERGLFLLLTRGNQASLRMRGEMSSAGFAKFETGIRGMSGTELLFSNRDARIYRIVTSPRRQA